MRLFRLFCIGFFCVLSWGRAEEALSKWAKLKFDVEGDLKNPLSRKTNWILRPEEDLFFIQHMNKQLGLCCEEKLYTADSNSLEEMSQYPFIFMHAEQYPILSAQQRKNIREYILRGGFLYIDDCLYRGGKELPEGGWGTLFFDAMMKIMPDILPEAKFYTLQPDHEIFRIYYKTPWFFSPYRGGRANELPDGRFVIMESSRAISRQEFEKSHYTFHGIEYKNRLVGIITGTDLHCDWSGRYGKEQAVIANEMMINIYLYAMTH
jgi:hypothetical protein